MGRQAIGVLYAVLMAAVVVAVDLLFFRDRFWATAASEYRHCHGVRSILLSIPERSMTI